MPRTAVPNRLIKLALEAEAAAQKYADALLLTPAKRRQHDADPNARAPLTS